MQQPRASVGATDVVISGVGVTARGMDGRELRQYAFDPEWRHRLSDGSERLRVVGGHEPGVYFTTSHRDRRTDGLAEGGQLTALTLSGRPRWTFTFHDTVTIGGTPYGPPWAVTAFSIFDGSDRRRRGRGRASLDVGAERDRSARRHRHAAGHVRQRRMD